MPCRSIYRRAAQLAACAALAGGPAGAQTPLFQTGEGQAHLLVLQTAFSCPISHLSELYTALAEASEVLDVMAVETEVLAICRERQQRLAEIAQAEIELRAVLGIADPATGAARVSITEGDTQQQPLLVSCPDPGTTSSPDQLASEPALVGSEDDSLMAAASAAQGGLPSALAPAATGSAAADALAALLAALDRSGASEGGNCQAEWSWAWTGRDHARRHTALLVSPDGARQEVTIGDRLPSGQTVTAITQAGVVVDDISGQIVQLPAYDGQLAAQPLPDAAEAEALRPEVPGEARDQTR